MIFIFCGKITGRVYGQSLALGPAFPVSDTIDYITAEFTFETPDWDGAEKWVHFTKDDKAFVAKLTDNKLSAEKHINLAAGVWEIYLHGNKDGTRITTNVCLLKVKPTGVIDGKPLPEVPLTAAEQIALDADNALKKAEEASEKAELAIRKADEISEVKTEVGKIKNDVADIKKTVEHISEEKVKEYADRAEKAARDIAVKADNHEKRISNLESAVMGKITETATFADKVTYRGMTVPENILPYARLNRIGGITKAVATKGTSPGGSAAGEDFTVTTWNDVPSDIKYIRSRGFNQGGCIPYTDGEFSIPLTFVQDGKSYDLANHCTFSDDGTITVAFHDYEVSSYIGSCSGDFKIKGSISQSKVPSFITARVNKFPVVLDGTRYKIQSSADEMRCVPLEIVKPSGTTITVTAEGYRIYGSKGFVGDIAPNSFNATTEWTKTDPNDNPNRKVTDYYFEVSCKNFASYDWSDFKLKLRLGVFNTSETMTVEMYRKYTPPTLVERPTLPSGKYMHGFSKKFSNFLTFSDDGKVTYTDNYRKYVCDIAHYEEHAESISYIMDNAFIDSVVEVPITNPWFASLPSVSGIDYYQARPDYEFVCSTLTPSEMTALLAKNVGAFVSRTLDPDEITVTEIAEDFDPIIPLYEKGAVQFIDSDGEPTDGILDITYQTKVTEA